MKVRFLQSGGLLGISKECELDTRTLPEEIAGKLDQLVRGAGIESDATVLSPGSRDVEQYDITIEDGERRSAVSWDALTVPRTASPLVAFLKQQSRPQPLR